MDENKKIYSSLTSIMSEIEAVTKNKTNSAQGYKYRSIDDVYNMIQPIFGKHKVFILPKVIKMEEQEKQAKSGSILIYTTIEIEYYFYADDGSSLSTIAIGKGMDLGDKSLDKAKSSALKYLLLQMFLIPTEEDKDIEKDSQELHKPKPAQKPAEKPSQSTTQTQDQAEKPLTTQDVINTILAIDQKDHLSNWLNKHKAGIKFSEIKDVYYGHLKLLTQAEVLAEKIGVKLPDMVAFMKANDINQYIKTCIDGKQESIDAVADLYTNYMASREAENLFDST